MAIVEAPLRFNALLGRPTARTVTALIEAQVHGAVLPWRPPKSDPPRIDPDCHQDNVYRHYRLRSRRYRLLPPIRPWSFYSNTIFRVRGRRPINNSQSHFRLWRGRGTWEGR